MIIKAKFNQCPNNRTRDYNDRFWRISSRFMKIMAVHIVHEARNQKSSTLELRILL